MVILVVVESDCASCDLPCIYDACKFYKSIKLYCDKCGEESDDLWYFGTQELCKDCILNELERVEYYDKE